MKLLFTGFEGNNNVFFPTGFSNNGNPFESTVTRGAHSAYSQRIGAGSYCTLNTLLQPTVATADFYIACTYWMRVNTFPSNPTTVTLVGNGFTGAYHRVILNGNGAGNATHLVLENSSGVDVTDVELDGGAAVAVANKWLKVSWSISREGANDTITVRLHDPAGAFADTTISSTVAKASTTLQVAGLIGSVFLYIDDVCMIDGTGDSDNSGFPDSVKVYKRTVDAEGDDNEYTPSGGTRVQAVQTAFDSKLLTGTAGQVQNLGLASGPAGTLWGAQQWEYGTLTGSRGYPSLGFKVDGVNYEGGKIDGSGWRHGAVLVESSDPDPQLFYGKPG